MRVLLAGAGGMLAHDIVAEFADLDVVAATRADLDITDRDAVIGACRGVDVVVNAAAYTRVDDAETDEAAAFAVNADGAANLAEGARSADAMLIHISTDYVFDGSAHAPYDEDAPLSPIGVYGRSKAAGEIASRELYPRGSRVVRTGWLYGSAGPSFPTTMLRLAEERETVKVVDDQVGAPTWSRDLARQLRAMVDVRPGPGVYHGTSAGSTTWFDFARAVFKLNGLDPERILPTSSTEFARPAPRPAYSVLGHSQWASTGVAPLRHWRDAVTAAFDPRSPGSLGVGP